MARALAANHIVSGPFVVATVRVNDAGFTEYLFGERPYVHSTEDGATQDARRRSRIGECETAVFKRVTSIDFELVSAETLVIEADKLAQTLTRKLREKIGEGHLDYRAAEKLVKAVLLESSK